MYNDSVIATEQQVNELVDNAYRELETYAKENKHSDMCAEDVARAEQFIAEFIKHKDIVAFEHAVALQDTFVRDYFVETLTLAEEYIDTVLLAD